MRKTRTQKGITLIALIITIAVLLILAAVAINSIQDDGILSYTQNATDSWNQAQKNEQSLLDGYLEYIEGSSKILDTNGNDVRNKKVSTNTTAYDKFGNKIVIPAGFMIRVDASTNNADTVTEGIVIEDCTETTTKESQFVWIPVGEKIYTNEQQTTYESVIFGRYSFNSTTGTPTAYSGTSWVEDIAENASKYDYAIARNIESYKTSVTKNGGYYIGRYEARTDSTTDRASGSKLTGITCVKTNTVYNYVKQKDASNLCREMYGDGYKSGTFSSDLINSYAWDTALVFIQTFSGTTTYSIEEASTTFYRFGYDSDNKCNIYGMSSNGLEFTTEMQKYSKFMSSPGTFMPIARCSHNTRNGGWIDDYFVINPGNRQSGSEGNLKNGLFRVILYVA